MVVQLVLPIPNDRHRLREHLARRGPRGNVPVRLPRSSRARTRSKFQTATGVQLRDLRQNGLWATRRLRAPRPARADAPSAPRDALVDDELFEGSLSVQLVPTLTVIPWTERTAVLKPLSARRAPADAIGTHDGASCCDARSKDPPKDHAATVGHQ